MVSYDLFVSVELFNCYCEKIVNYLGINNW